MSKELSVVSPHTPKAIGNTIIHIFSIAAIPRHCGFEILNAGLTLLRDNVMLTELFTQRLVPPLIATFSSQGATTAEIIAGFEWALDFGTKGFASVDAAKAASKLTGAPKNETLQ